MSDLSFVEAVKRVEALEAGILALVQAYDADMGGLAEVSGCEYHPPKKMYFEENKPAKVSVSINIHSKKKVDDAEAIQGTGENSKGFGIDPNQGRWMPVASIPHPDAGSELQEPGLRLDAS